MYKVFFFCKRRLDLSSEDLIREDVLNLFAMTRAPITMIRPTDPHRPSVLAYTRNDVIRNGIFNFGEQLDFDVLIEAWFVDAAAFEEASATLCGSNFGRLIGEDTASFRELEIIRRVAVNECHGIGMGYVQMPRKETFAGLM